MKKMLMMFALMPLLALADTWTDPDTGITWTYYWVGRGVASVVGGLSTTAIPTSTQGAITIPSSLGFRPVTYIGTEAFSGCSGLTSVTIPSSVTSIGYNAFSGCSGLTNVTISSSVTSIGNNAFYGCSGLTSVTIPSSVTSIGDSAFSACSGLTSVTISEGVTSIGEWAFLGCSGLTSVTIPSSVTSIGIGAFRGCSGLMAIEVDVANDSYCSLGGVLFNKDKTELMAYPGGKEGDYVIPSGVTSIGTDAFLGRSGLTSVTIPSSVTSIGNYAFCSCSGLTSMTIPSSVAIIGDSAFSCSGLTSVTISEGVAYIGRGAFSYCNGLTSVTIPSSVRSTGPYAFEGCSGLTNVMISEGVTYIDVYSFSGCSGLTNVTISSSVTSIGSSAFYGCSGLTSVDFEGAPPNGLSAAYVRRDAAIRYNVAYEDEWLPVIKVLGFTNVTPYVPGVGKKDIDKWVESTLVSKFKGTGETTADYRKRFEAKFGDNYSAAFFKDTGKVGQGGTNLQVWHDYVAGTDPLNTNDVFTATITFGENGVPKVEYKPTFKDANEAALRKYTTLGKKSLADEKWEEVAEGREANYNFFKVTVEMK